MKRATATTSSCSASGRGGSGQGWARWRLRERLRLPSALGVAVAALPIALNWSAVNRRSEPEASLPREVARSAARRASAARSAVRRRRQRHLSALVRAAGRANLRRDVTVVTLPLLAASWYVDELARRDSLVTSGTHAATGRVALSEIAAARERRGGRSRSRSRCRATTATELDRSLEGCRTVAAGRSPHAAMSADSTAQPVVGADRLGCDAARRRARSSRGEMGASARPSLDPVHEYFLNVLSCPRLALVPTPSTPNSLPLIRLVTSGKLLRYAVS